jgi:hypothetical protein
MDAGEMFSAKASAWLAKCVFIAMENVTKE